MKTNIDFFSNETLEEIKDCLLCLNQANKTVLKHIIPKCITYQNILLRIITSSSSLERTFVTNPLIQ